MKKLFRLTVKYEDKSTDEYFCQEHNITLAKTKLLSMTKTHEKPVKICEYVKMKNWEKRIDF